MKTISLITLLTFMISLIPTLGYSQDSDLLYDDLEEGQPAPFSGMLLNPAAVAKMQVEIKYCDEKLKIEVDYAVKKEKAESELKINLLQSELDFWKQRYEISEKYSRISEERLIKELKKSSKPEKDAILIFSGMLIGAGMVFLGGGLTIEMSKKN